MLATLPFLTLLLIRRLMRTERWLVWAMAVGGFVLFCAFLKWQPWHARLHLPIVSLLCPVLGAAMDRRRGAAMVIGALSLIPVAVTALRMDARPLAGRGSVFTTGRDRLLLRGAPYITEAAHAVELVRRLHPRTVSVWPRHVQIEYALERMLLDAIEPEPKFVTFSPRFRPRNPDEQIDALIFPSDTAMTLVNRPTGEVLPCVYEGLFFAVCASERLVAQHGLAIVPAPFSGFANAEGLSRKLPADLARAVPAVRMGVAPRTSLYSRAVPGPMELRANCQSRSSNPVELRFVANGRPLGSRTLDPGAGFQDLAVAFDSVHGANTIAIEYWSNGSPCTGEPVAYHRLMVTPRSP